MRRKKIKHAQVSKPANSSKRNKGKTKEQVVLRSSRKKQNLKDQKIHFIDNPNVNGLKFLIKRCRLADWIKNKSKDIHLTGNNIHRLKVKGMKNDIPSKYKLKTCKSSCTHIRQSRQQAKISQKRRSLHILKGNNPSRRYNDCKFIHTKY
jgi:hypothetical protein